MAEERRDRGGQPGRGGRPGDQRQPQQGQSGRAPSGQGRSGGQPEGRGPSAKEGRRFGRRRSGRPGPREDRARDEKAKTDRAREDRAKAESSRDDRARDDRAREDRAREEQAREDRAREERARAYAAAEPEPPPAESLGNVDCPLCGKPVYDLTTAVCADKDSGAPAHFDCVLERVAAAETLGPSERLVYLGSGSFGVVEFKDKSESAFVVKRRVQWEKEGDKKPWRRGLSTRITRI